MNENFIAAIKRERDELLKVLASEKDYFENDYETEDGDYPIGLAVWVTERIKEEVEG